MFEMVDSHPFQCESNWYIGGTTWEIGWGGGSRSSQPPLLLTPSIDNGFAVPLRNRDEERGVSQYRGCLSIRQWFRAKLTITEVQMEPQRGGRISFTVARSGGYFRSPRGFEGFEVIWT